MIPSTLCALVAVLSSLAAANGAVIQRDGTFTYLTPQPTAGGAAPTTASSTTATQSTTATTATTATIATTATTATTATATTSSVATTRPTTPTSTIATQPTTATATTSSGSTTVKTTASSTPTATATATATSTPPPGGAANCNGVQQWQASFAYTAGDQVIFNGQLFTARQWTYNNAPPSHLDQWAAGGTCAQPINNQANCKGVAAWQSTVAYTTGNRVTFNGHLWSAVQWAQSNPPGDTSGSWMDLGACA